MNEKGTHSENDPGCDAEEHPNTAVVNALLERIRAGDARASAELFELHIPELYGVAVRQMRGQKASHTLQATALVNEAYLRLFRAGARTFENRSHFLLVAARAMRQILVDHSRKNSRLKRAGERIEMSLEAEIAHEDVVSFDFDALNAALEKLERLDSNMAKAVELRFFGGLGPADTASTLGMKQRTFDRRWVTTLQFLTAEVAPG